MTLAQLSWQRFRMTLNLHATTLLVGVILTHEPKHLDEDWDEYIGRWRLSVYVGPFRVGLAIYQRGQA